MAKQPYRTPDYCPIEITQRLINGKWKAVILFHLLKDTQRLRDFERELPKASRRMLTLALRELERDALVIRTVCSGAAPCVTYELTVLGRSLEPVLESMNQWAKARFGP